MFQAAVAIRAGREVRCITARQACKVYGVRVDVEHDDHGAICTERNLTPYMVTEGCLLLEPQPGERLVVLDDLPLPPPKQGVSKRRPRPPQGTPAIWADMLERLKERIKNPTPLQQAFMDAIDTVTLWGSWDSLQRNTGSAYPNLAYLALEIYRDQILAEQQHEQGTRQG